MRIAYILHRIEPYYTARLHRLAAVLDEVLDADLRVFALAPGVPPHDLSGLGVSAETLVARSPGRRTAASELISRLDSYSPDATVAGGYSPAPLRAAARWAHENERGSIVVSTSHRRLDSPSLDPRELTKRWWLSRYVDAVCVSGVRAADYMRSLGVHPHRIWRVGNVVDNDMFQRNLSIARRPSLPERFFLYVGRLSREKNVHGLLAAYHLYQESARQERWSLVLVGSGPEEAGLRRAAARLTLRGVMWLGQLPWEDLPAVYAKASALVLPSTDEPWGLVVNEAMASGLPVLVSERCGCVPELVFPGRNGWVFDPDDMRSIATALHRVAAYPYGRSLCEEARRLVAQLSLDSWANTLAACVRDVVSTRARQDSVSHP